MCAAWHQSCQIGTDDIGVFLRIDNGVIQTGHDNTTNHCLIVAGLEGIRFKSGLWETEVLEFNEFSRARLRVVVKYAVKFSITDIVKFDKK